MTGSRRLFQGLFVMLTAVLALATNTTRAFADDAADDTITGCVWCGETCPGDLAGYCQTHCGGYNNPPTCIVANCHAYNGNNYPYRIYCNY
jgi:hypothetical protein